MKSQMSIKHNQANGWRIVDFFTETSGFMAVIQEQVICTNNCKEYILCNLNITSDICRKYRKKSETLR